MRLLGSSKASSVQSELDTSELIKANYVKEIDSLSGEPIYRNRRTGYISRRKPVFLGNDDLETPRYFAALDNYDPGKSAIPQFAVIITNQEFESPKIPTIPEQVLADHDALRETLEHPYFSKFQSENCFFVKNATSEVMTASLASVQRQISSTMARLKKESEKRAKALRKEREARALERRNARRAENTEDEGGGGVSNVAHLREEGERQDGNKGQEDVDSEEEDGDEEEEEEEEEFDPEEGLLLVYVCTHVAVISKGKGVAGTYLVATDTSWKSREQLATSAVLLQTFAAAIDRIQLRHKVLFLDVVHTERKHEGFKTRHLYPPRNLYDSAAVLCGAVVVGSCRIGQTSEVDLDVLRGEAADFWAAVEPRHNRGGKNKARARKGALASGGGSGMAKGQQHEEGGMRACAAVYDRANYEDIMSVFGRAVRDGLKGQCVENTKLSRVLVVHLYDFIRREFSPFAHPRLSVAQEEAEAAGGGAGGGGVVGGNSKREKAAAKKKAAAEKKAKKEADRAEAKRRARLGAKALAEEVRQAKEVAMLREVEEEKRQRTQVPVIAGLSISAIARATACASPSPPPQPLIPFPIEITRTSVRLAWDDPPFPGEPPFLYELEAKGDLRGNSTWASVFPPRFPSISSQPVNISHRVPGLGLRYRVRACNHGGWGAASDPTEVVTTKAWLEDTGANSAARAMKSLARAGGARLVLARMRRYSASLLNQESGFHQLVAEFNKGLGIPRASLAEEVAVVVADAMEAFSQVRGIQDSGLLLLGWAARGKGEAGSDVLSADLVERCLGLVATAEKLHSMDVAIKGHAIWARSHLLRWGEGRGDAGAIVEYSVASSEDDVWAGASSLAEQDVGKG
ncbi:hypothetical protein Esi_0002_0051 [Ectocarpus siliculosus]|uniref:Fibronectin type-III domain-containing protein n=1 Tax=Ectocarpus siliculosus TaxID=2880 RepID=D7FPY8_ECTSI|nr:hypothetical protein Esi_0002_0051 [Ectocarpus siliculosus]|eukprot:CBJ48320.1 hypothetical protein Esi_0002_0051 [Ectocarpus siliculosus]